MSEAPFGAPPTAAEVFADKASREGGAVQTAGSRYATATHVQKPRDPGEIEAQVKDEAQLLANAAYYGWGVGTDKEGHSQEIEGPAIKLANVLQRLWGNCAIQLEPVQDLPDCWIFTAVFIDLETGSTLSRQFRQSKSSIVYGKHDEQRKMEIRFQIGQSKAIRNVILNALPAWLVTSAMHSAKGGVLRRIREYIERDGLPAAQKTALDAVAKHGIDAARVCKRFDIASTDELTDDMLGTMMANLSAIQRGEVRADELYPNGKPQTKAEKRAAHTKPKAAPKPPPPPMKVPGLIIERIAAIETQIARVGDRAFGVLGNHGIADIGELHAFRNPLELKAILEELTALDASAQAPGQQPAGTTGKQMPLTE